jgi:hypothetical protein
VGGREDEGVNVRHEWRFLIGDAFPADDPLARFLVAVAAALNDNILSHTLFVQADNTFDHIYLFNLASSHLYEAAETLEQAAREWPEVQTFVDGLDDDRRSEFERVAGLARQGAAWPAARLKELRNLFFHYFRLDRAAADVNQLPLIAGLEAAADRESTLVIEPGQELSGIRSEFAYEAAIAAMTRDFEDDELQRLITTLARLQGDLNRFAQAALGRYLRELPEGAVIYQQQAI